MKPYTHFTPEERICLYEMRRNHEKIQKIAETLGRDRSTIYRELKRNSNRYKTYSPLIAYCMYAHRRKKCRRKPRIVKGSKLWDYINREIRLYWSPELIAETWNREHPDDTIAFATIYRAIYAGILPGISASSHLRRRGKNAYPNRTKYNTIQPLHTIHDWDSVIRERGRFGDWEGDTIRGKNGKSGLLTLVDRKARYLIVGRLKGFSAREVEELILSSLDGVCTKSVTFDNGPEFAAFKDLEERLGVPVFFTDPHSPWQRGSNENLNGLLRYFFPKGTDFNLVSDAELAYVVELINSRPRFCLDLASPSQVFCCT